MSLQNRFFRGKPEIRCSSVWAVNVLHVYLAYEMCENEIDRILYLMSSHWGIRTNHSDWLSESACSKRNDVTVSQKNSRLSSQTIVMTERRSWSGDTGGNKKKYQVLNFYCFSGELAVWFCSRPMSWTLFRVIIFIIIITYMILFRVIILEWQEILWKKKLSLNFRMDRFSFKIRKTADDTHLPSVLL